MKKKFFSLFLFFVFFAIILNSVEPPPKSLSYFVSKHGGLKVFARNGELLNLNFNGGYNTTHIVPLHRIPLRLQKFFLLAEDQSFYQHRGVDWQARLSALWLNIRKAEVKRGASTITEQVIRMLHPRPRTFYSKIIETFESWWLESRATKGEILEFYLNQVPYASQRRGVLQASLFYFDRDLETLNLKEQLALAVLIRSPSFLDLYKNPKRIESRLMKLASLAYAKGLINKGEWVQLSRKTLTLKKRPLQAKPWAFIDWIKRANPKKKVIHSSLDFEVQHYLEQLLNERVKNLKKHKVTNGAALVVDRQKGDILAYAVSGRRQDGVAGSWYDTIQVKRQPGSTLKPFLYSLAFNNGRTAAEPIKDEPLDEPVSLGIHQWNNYSGQYYGWIDYRLALANSLNVPAVKLVGEIGVPYFLWFLQKLGIESLDRNPDFYGKGLALGNGEMSLYELVQAYTTLANQGNMTFLRFDLETPVRQQQSVLSSESTSIVSDILSDPVARRFEFGDTDLYNYPSQTAIKTGTSTGYRDAWFMAYNDRFVVGVWMGNLNQATMDEITGSKGPALVVNGLFKKLNAKYPSQNLYLSPRLHSLRFCQMEGSLDFDCDGGEQKVDWFFENQKMESRLDFAEKKMKIRFPFQGTILAIDPRLSAKAQAIHFALENSPENISPRWLVDDKEIQGSQWVLQPGRHTLEAKVFKGEKLWWQSKKIKFSVVE